MRNPKLLLVPLIPALAFGIVEVASRISMPTAAPIAAPSVVMVQYAAPAQVEPTTIEPVFVPEPTCRGCTTAE